MARKITTAQQTEALASLRKLLKPGSEVFTILRHRSTSGMSRVIDLVIPVTASRTTTKPATGRGLKIGAEVMATPADRSAVRAFSYGRVKAFDKTTVTVTYDAAAHAPAAEITWPRADVQIYVREEYASIRSIGWLFAQAGGYTFDSDRQGVKIGGAGMDMGFHLVYSLGRIVWPDGTPSPHGTRNGAPDRDGGYALKHSWL